MPIRLAPLSDLQQQVEVVAGQVSRAPASRVAELRALSEHLKDLLARIGTYIGDLELEREAQALNQSFDLLRARENATLREELLRQGTLTDEELDEVGYLSHEELDRLAEEGLLESRLVGLAKKWEEALHPRGKGGKFSEKFGTPAASGESKARPGAPSYQERRREFEQKVGERVTSEVEKTRERLSKGKARTRTGPASSADLSDGEVHINSAGKISQHTLGRYARMALSGKSSLEEHSKVDPDGNRVWTPEREALHRKIIDLYLRQQKWNQELKGGKGDYDFDPEGEYHRSVDNPEVMFSGGGYAAGKGTTVKQLEAQGRTPESGYDGPPLTLDPDKIKAMFPEFDENDPEANARVYEEAWLVAQEIQRQAMEQRMNLVVDGISNTSAEEMAARAQEFLDNGYSARALYVDIPTDEALRRAAERAQKAKDASDKRMIPEVVMRAVHRDVAATVPELIEHLQDSDVPLAVEVWDNDQGRDSVGGFRPPKRIASYEPGGALTVEDTNLWERFKVKADEEILGVDMPPETVSIGVTPYRREEDKFGEVAALASAGDLPEARAVLKAMGDLSDDDKALLRQQMERMSVSPTSIGTLMGGDERIAPGVERVPEDFFYSTKFKNFERKLLKSAKEHDITIASKGRVEGVRGGEPEPSYEVLAHNGPEGLRAWAEEMRESFDHVLLFDPGESGPDATFALSGVEDREAAFQAMADAGLADGHLQGGVLEIIGPLGIYEQIQKLREAIGIDDVEFVQGNFQVVGQGEGS